jgi:hypothetical protein
MKDSVLVYVGGYFASMSFYYDRDGERFCLYTLARREPDDTNLIAMRYMGGNDKKLFQNIIIVVGTNSSLWTEWSLILCCFTSKERDIPVPGYTIELYTQFYPPRFCHVLLVISRSYNNLYFCHIARLIIDRNLNNEHYQGCQAMAMNVCVEGQRGRSDAWIYLRCRMIRIQV